MQQGFTRVTSYQAHWIIFIFNSITALVGEREIVDVARFQRAICCGISPSPFRGLFTGLRKKHHLAD